MSSVTTGKPSVFSRARQALSVFPSKSGETLKSPDEIAGLLTRLGLEEPIVDVVWPKAGRSFSGAVVEVSQDAQRIWLDELSSDDSATAPTVKASLKVSGNLDGASISFTAAIAEIVERDGIPCYGLARPRRIKRQQRRAHRRFAAVQLIHVYLVDSAAKLQHAVLHDISLGGLAARVFSDHGLALSRGDRLPGCTIKLPNRALQCVLEVRHVQRDEDESCWIFGARFVALAERQENVLNQFIANADTN